MVESQKMFEDMIRSIERMRSEVTKLIGINEKAAFNQAEALIERLEQEIDELKKKESGLKQLYSTEDHIHFLQVGPKHRSRQCHTLVLCRIISKALVSQITRSIFHMRISHHLTNLRFPLPFRTLTTCAPPLTMASYHEWRWTLTSPLPLSERRLLRLRSVWKSLDERS